MTEFKGVSLEELSEPVRAIANAIINLQEIDPDRLLMVYDKSTVSGAEYIGICYKQTKGVEVHEQSEKNN